MSDDAPPLPDGEAVQEAPDAAAEEQPVADSAADPEEPVVEEMSAAEAAAPPAMVRRLSQEEHKEMFYHSQTIAADTRGHQLLSLEQGQLAVTEAGGNILEKLDPHRNVNLVFIFGNARSGKSFMMNCLAGKQGVFQVINTAEPCTKGVDMSSFVMEHSHLAKHTKQAVSPNNPLLGFVDVEGQGAEDNSYDTMLALPLLLTGKVCLFNHKGAPTVTDMLGRLGVLARAANFVQLEEDEKGDGDGDGDGDDEDSGDDSDAEREKKRKMNSKTRKFGHLHVLFRDFSFDATREMVMEQLFTKEKIKKGKKGIGTENAIKAAKERNDIRQLLQDNFQSINVWLFKQPATADELKAHKELPGELVDPEFAGTVKQLLSTIAAQTAEPTMFNKQPVSGPKLKDLLGRVCTVLNTGEAINVPSVYHAMEKDTVEKVGKMILKWLEDAVGRLRKDLPLSVDALKAKVEATREKAHKDFDAELSSCTLEDELKTKKGEIDKALEVYVEDLQRTNAVLTLKWMNEVVSAEVQVLRKQFEEWCEQELPVDDTEEIHSAFKEIKAVSYMSITDALATLPDVPKEELAARWTNEEASLVEFLTTKVLKNDAMQKEEKIAALQEEAIQIQTKLVEQNKKLGEFLEEEKKHTVEMEQKLKQLEAAKGEEAKRVEEARAQEAKLLAEVDKQREEVARLRKEAEEARKAAEEEKKKADSEKKKSKCVIL